MTDTMPPSRNKLVTKINLYKSNICADLFNLRIYCHKLGKLGLKKIFLKVHNTEIQAILNDTIAVQDFYSRLPLTLEFTDSGVDYCCKYLQGDYAMMKCRGVGKTETLFGTAVFYQ